MRRTTLAILLTLFLCVPALAGGPSIRFHDLRDIRASAQSTPNMTVAVASGEVYVVGAQVAYAGGNSPSFTAPGSNNRIDILTINASGTLAVTQGSAAATPTAPTAPTGTMPICTVYLKSTSTSIQAYNTGTATHGYILKDLRPFIMRSWLTPLGTFDIEPTLTATDNIITIANQGPLGANDYLDHIHIDGDNLDPSGVEAEVHGIHIDFSGIDTTHLPILSAFEADMPRDGDRAISISQGFFEHRLVPSSVALTEHVVYSVIIDASSQDATSETHGVDVALASSLSGTVAALGVHPGIDVLHQHIGSFASFGATYAGRLTSGPTYSDDIDGQNIWVAHGDSILVGHTVIFDEIDLAFTTPATKDAFLLFYYYKTGVGWTAFFPGDDTDGGRNDGTIRYVGADLTNWQSNYDPNGGAADAGYWIKITRNRVNSPGTVALSTAKYLVATSYMWDKDGLIHCSELQVGLDDLAVGEGHFYGAATGSADGGCLKLYTGADHDTSISNWGLNVDEDDLNIKMGTTTVFTFTGADGHMRLANTYDLIPATSGGSDLGDNTHAFGQLYAAQIGCASDADIFVLTANTLGINAVTTTHSGLFTATKLGFTPRRDLGFSPSRYMFVDDTTYKIHSRQLVASSEWIWETESNTEMSLSAGTLRARLTIDQDLLVASSPTFVSPVASTGFIGPQIGPSGDADLLAMAANALTVSGDVIIGGDDLFYTGSGNVFDVVGTTSDGSDNVNLRVGAGGAIGPTRGASFTVYPNESVSTNFQGAMYFLAGNSGEGGTYSDSILFYTGGALRWRFHRDGTLIPASGELEVVGNCDVTGHYEVDNVQVVTNRQAFINDADGTLPDATATVNQVLDLLIAHGLMAGS